MDDLLGHLMAHETRIEKHSSANVASRSQNLPLGRSQNPVAQRLPSSGQSRLYQGHTRSSGSSRTHGPPVVSRYQGRGLLPTPSHMPFSNGPSSYGPPHDSRPIYQVCGKMGHIALNCYRKFDHIFQAARLNLTAYTAAPSQIRDSNWYPDTGATHHITSDLNNLNIHSEAYDGPDEIQVGNDTCLAIKNTGISKLYPHFILNNILHVPQITKNLLSIQKFTSDNNVYVEFHPSCFFIKDRIFGKILHQAPSRNGLYHWFPPTAASPSVFSSSRTTFVDWHARLRHPSDRIVHHVISKFQLPYVSNKKHTICPTCQQGKSHKLHFSIYENKSSVPLELIFSDIWGPSPILSNNGARFYVIFVDHFSKFTWLYPIACKSDVFTIFPKF